MYLVEKEAIFVTATPKIALYDVRHLLRKHKTKKERPRPQLLDRYKVAIHHSGATGRVGLRGVLASLNYVLNKKNRLTRRPSPFPAFPYHIWVPYHDVRDMQGRSVVYVTRDFEARAWHTGGKINDERIGLVFQGNSSRRVRSDAAMVLAELSTVFTDKIDWNDPCPHSLGKQFGGSKSKDSCPGRGIEAAMVTNAERLLAVNPTHEQAKYCVLIKEHYDKRYNS